MRLTIFRDIPEEHFPSMENYADNIITVLKKVNPELKIKQFSIHKTNFIRPLRLIFRFLPWLKDYAHDLFFSRYLLYPLLAKFHQGDVNLIVDHSYGHVVNFLNPDKTIVVCHDVFPLKLEKIKVNLELFRYSIESMKKAAKIISVSQTTKNELIEQAGFNPDKIIVIPEAVDSMYQKEITDDQIKEVKQRFQIPEGKLLLHVGSNLLNKNIERILQVVKKLLDDRENVYFLKVGAEFSKEQKKLIDNLNISDRVIHLGYVKQEDLPVIYKIVDCLVFVSLYEGFGFPILEAMSCGCPVVTSDVSSMPEVAGDAAILVNPESVDAIVNGVKTIFHDEKRRQDLINKGYEQVKKFSWEKCARETLAVFEEVMRDREK